LFKLKLKLSKQFISAKTQIFKTIYFGENSNFQDNPLAYSLICPVTTFSKNEQGAEVTVYGRSLRQKHGYSRSIILKPMPKPDKRSNIL
jgi:hypothetical protein